jgi:hypothetical protein
MKLYYKTKLYGAGHPQIGQTVFATDFSSKKEEKDFWNSHETTHAKFTRFLKKEIKGELLIFLKEELFVNSRKEVINELDHLCPYTSFDID